MNCLFRRRGGLFSRPMLLILPVSTACPESGSNFLAKSLSTFGSRRLPPGRGSFYASCDFSAVAKVHRSVGARELLAAPDSGADRSRVSSSLPRLSFLWPVRAAYNRALPAGGRSFPLFESVPVADFLQTCEEAARAGGAVLLDWIGRFGVREKGRSDPVTDADLASQEAIRRIVLGRFPNHCFHRRRTGWGRAAGRPAIAGWSIRWTAR